MANKSTYGEALFAKCLISQSIPFEREPKLPGMSQLIDFVIDHAASGKVLIEVKDIQNAPAPRSFSQINIYEPIRSHIEDGREKFKCAQDYVCALVLAAVPGNFVTLEEPHTMLGAMYGDFGYKIPLDPGRGKADAGRKCGGAWRNCLGKRLRIKKTAERFIQRRYGRMVGNRWRGPTEPYFRWESSPNARS